MSKLTTVLYAPPFDPRRLGSLAIWLDASQLFGVADGAEVATWNDLSGNGNDATQSTSSKRPTYQTNILNGRPALQFDGVDDFLATAVLSYPQPNTVFVVVSTPAAGANSYDIIDGHSTGDRTKLSVLDSASSGHLTLFAGASLIGSVDRSNATHIFTGIFDGASNSESFVDGVSESGPGDGGTQAVAGLTIGAKKSQNGNFFKDYIFEFMVFNERFVAGKLREAWRYLGRKYGLAYA